MDLGSNDNWELLEAMLAAEASGKSPRLFSSRRTLFGIPSALDEELAALSAGSSPCKEAGKKADQERTEDGRTLVVHPLDPVFNERSKVLILGTMPSPRSRETGFYYNHPQNRFWKVMARILDAPLPTSNDEKRELMLSHGIALWDVLARCVIDGAKDVSIGECVPNDLTVITAHAPIEAIFCTGAKAYELYGRYCEERTGLKAIKLSSTSPANAAASLEDLVVSYRQITKYL